MKKIEIKDVIALIIVIIVFGLLITESIYLILIGMIIQGIMKLIFSTLFLGFLIGTFISHYELF